MKSATGAKKKSATYAPYRSFQAFLIKYLNQSDLPRIALGEVRTAFGNIPRSTATRTAQRLAKAGLIKVHKHEQLWMEKCATLTSWLGTTTTTTATYNRKCATLRRFLAPPENVQHVPRKMCNPSDVAWPSPKGPEHHDYHNILASHRFRFPSIRYEGAFEYNENTRYSGRYHHVPTTFFRYGTHTIVMHRSKLAIWIHDGQGAQLAAQREDARGKALARLATFAQERSLSLQEHDLARINGSEHTIADEGVDAVIRPIVQTEPEFMDSRLGMAINHSSHPQKIELHERNPEVGPQFSRGRRMEWLIDDFAQDKWEKLLDMHISDRHLIAELTGAIITLRQEVAVIKKATGL